jgi:Kef-type K+ transport system membrane component KefB
MNELASLGLLLLMAVLVGELAKATRIPEVTGYLLAGLALGPSVLGWISSANVDTLHVMSQVALGMILFSVGSALDFSQLRLVGRRILIITAVEAGVTGTLVTLCMLALGMPWMVALLLGCISMSTAPAATMMVLREQNSGGPLTDMIVSVVAVNKVVVLVAFTVVAAVVTIGQGGDAHTGIVSVVGESIFWLLWELAGSVALGYLIGLMLAGWGSKLMGHGEVQILLAGSVLLCVGLSIHFDLSPLISSMVIGATVANLSASGHRLGVALSRFDPPIYAMFFVIAGAGIHLDRLAELGLVGVTYVAARAAGKLVGFRFGCLRAGVPGRMGLLLGMAMLALADLAVGLTIEVARRFPDLQESVSAIVLGAVALYETLGPLGTRYAILRSGEADKGNRNGASVLAAEPQADASPPGVAR